MNNKYEITGLKFIKLRFLTKRSKLINYLTNYNLNLKKIFLSPFDYENNLKD